MTSYRREHAQAQLRRSAHSSAHSNVCRPGGKKGGSAGYVESTSRLELDGARTEKIEPIIA